MGYGLIPPAASLVLGLIFLFTADARPLAKVLLAGLYLLAVYLQFASPYRLVGLILQVLLAVGLALWMKTG